MTEALDVWLYGTRIAVLRRGSTNRINLTWDQAAIARWGDGSRVLSTKLPMGSHIPPPLVRAYLDGLLPEGNARTNHAIAAGVPPDDTFGLIRAYGRDTPGAALFTEGDAPDPSSDGTYEPLTAAQVGERLRNADAQSPARFDELTGESSTLPGMVPKITLHRDKSTWFACRGGAPSTWILKRAFPLDSGVGDVIDTEAACLDLGRRVGVTTVEAEVLDFGDHRGIAVSRYDRPEAGQERRLHQEDLAQAIGLNTLDPNRKFQYGAQMPSLGHAAEVLQRDGGSLDDLLRLITFSHLVGNTDMHAKNISFLRLRDGRVRLAPAYDVAMHLHHPRDNRRSALDVNRKFAMADIDIEDVIAEGESWGLSNRRARGVVTELVVDLAGALRDIDREAHPGVTADAWRVVFERVANAALSVPAASLASNYRSERRAMPSSVSLRQKIADLASKRAELEKKLGEAQRVRARKESDAADKVSSASKTKSDNLRKTYLRQAETAQKYALAEGRKIADLSKRLAAVAKDEAARHKELTSALRSEASADSRAADRERKERERQETRAAEQRRMEAMHLQQQRLADEQRLLDVQREQEETRSLINETDRRLTNEIAAIRSPKREELRILYATASPAGDLRVDQEMRRVEATVQASTHREQVAIKHLPAATPGDLLDGLLTFKPHVVHFSGHANAAEVVFDDGTDEGRGGVVVTSNALKTALEAPDEVPILVVLNACESAAQLRGLLGRVAMAVGMHASVGDIDAITFATRFYRSLAEGQSVFAALAIARADMLMNGLMDHDLPVLETLAGIDPTKVHLVQPPG